MEWNERPEISFEFPVPTIVFAITAANRNKSLRKASFTPPLRNTYIKYHKISSQKGFPFFLTIIDQDMLQQGEKKKGLKRKVYIALVFYNSTESKRDTAGPNRGWYTRSKTDQEAASIIDICGFDATRAIQQRCTKRYKKDQSESDDLMHCQSAADVYSTATWQNGLEKETCVVYFPLERLYRTHTKTQTHHSLKVILPSYIL